MKIGMRLLQSENVVSNFIRYICPPFLILFIKDDVSVRSFPGLSFRVKLQHDESIKFFPAVCLSAVPEQAGMTNSPGLTFYESVRKISTIQYHLRDYCISMPSAIWKENFNVGV